VQDQAEDNDPARRVFGLVAAAFGNGRRHVMINYHGREMAIGVERRYRIRLTGPQNSSAEF
jgi:hypothetical protein